MLLHINTRYLIYYSTTTCRHYSKLSYYHCVGEEPLRALTVGKLLEESAEKFGNRNAIVSRHQHRSITFKDALEEADKLAAGLRNLGLKRKDRLGLWAPNSIEWYITKMAAARAGLILVALNPAYQPPEIEYCINKVGIKGIICALNFKSQDYYKNLLAVEPEIENSSPGKLNSSKIPTLESIIMLEDRAKKGTLTYKEVLDLNSSEDVAKIKNEQNLVDPDGPCNIQFTSGTTGKPKAALTSHFNLVNNGFYIGKRNELNVKHHKICLQVPFFHAFGTTISIMAALNHGATLVLPGEAYDPIKNLEAVKSESCSIIHGTPTMYVDLVHLQERRNEDISPEIAVSGGSVCSSHLFKSMLRVLKVKKVKSVFGLTETTAVVFQSSINDNEEQSTSTVGPVVEHMEAKIIDNDGNIVPFGTPGELCVRGYANMLGYWGDEEKTKDTIGEDGWLKTGDQFILTEDGYGKIVGRLKEMIIRGGENIFPKEIEEFLNTHPDILETHVIGVPNERLGEEVCACVRVKPGSVVKLEDVKKFCEGKLAYFKIPAMLKVVESFPTTTSGKIQKFRLLESVKASSR